MINKLTIKYRMLPIQVRASLWFLICAFFQKGISFISTPIFTRLLSAAEYGQYSVFTSWTSILIVIVTLNLYCGVYTRGLVKFEEDKKVFSSSLQGLTITLVCLWSVIYLLFHEFWNRLFTLSTVQMIMMLLMMWTTVVFGFWSMEQRVDFKYRKLVITTVLVSIAKPVVGVIFVTHTQDKVTARIFGLALVEFIAYTVFFFGQMCRGKTFFSKKYWKHALLFNIPLIPHYLSMSVLNSADRIMIGRMVNEASAGIYSLAYSISIIMTMFNTAMMQTIEPWLYKKIKEQKIEDISKVAYPAFILVALLNIMLIAMAPEVVTIFAPLEYHDAIWIMPPVAMSVFFMFSYTFFAVFEFYYEKTKMIAMATCAGAVLNIILNYIFIKLFGFYAAGYTTLACYIVYAIFHYMFMRRICNQYLDGKQPYDSKIYFGISIGFMVLGFALFAAYEFPAVRYTFVVIILIVAFVMRKKLINLIICIYKRKEKDELRNYENKK